MPPFELSIAQVPGMASAKIKLGTERIFPCCPSQRLLAGSMHDLLTSKLGPNQSLHPSRFAGFTHSDDRNGGYSGTTSHALQALCG